MFYISKEAATNYVVNFLVDHGYTSVKVNRVVMFSDYGVPHVDVYFECEKKFLSPVYDDDAEDYKTDHINGLFTVWSDPKNYWSVNGLYGEW